MNTKTQPEMSGIAEAIAENEQGLLMRAQASADALFQIAKLRKRASEILILANSFEAQSIELRNQCANLHDIADAIQMAAKGVAK